MARRHLVIVVCVVVLATGRGILAQLIDRTSALNTSGDGIALSLAEQIGPGRGDWFTEDSSSFIINRDPFRAIRRGRQLFQRKFTLAEGRGARHGRRRRQHRPRFAHRRGSGRQLRRLPRPAARLGRLRRRRRHAARQPRRAAPVRPRPEGDARRRDDDRAARDPRAGASPPREARRTHRSRVTADRQGHSLRHAHRACRTAPSTPREVEGVDPDLRVRPFFAHGEHDLDPRVPGRRAERRDGPAGGRSDLAAAAAVGAW